MILLLLIHVLVYPSTMLWKIAHATGQIRPLMIRVLFLEICNLALTFYFVGALKWGAVGAALATLCVRTVGWPLLQWPLGLRMVEVTGRQWCRQTIIPGLLPGLVGAVVWLGLRMLGSPDSWLSLSKYVAIGMVCYLAVLLQFCLQPYERRELGRALRVLVPRQAA